MPAYILYHGRAAQKPYKDVHDFVKQQQNTIIYGQDHSKEIKVIADDQAMANIRSFAEGWIIEEPVIIPSPGQPKPSI